MKRTTVSLPDSVAESVQREARRRRTSVSDVMREALVAFLGLSGDEPRPIPFDGIFDSGHRNTARDIKKILREEWGRARDR
jgi:Arc/MetJ-type ribon-helix-helix transcriptional regulator